MPIVRSISYDEFSSPGFTAAWKQLLRYQGTYDIGNTYEWNRSWWESYQAERPWKKHWFLLAHKSLDESGAIFPFVIRSRFGIRIVEFLGQSGGFMTDYLGSIGGPDVWDSMVRELFDFLLAHTDRWDLISLRLPGWTNEVSSYVRNACLPSFAGKIRWKAEIPAYYVTTQLPGTFDEHLSSLGKKTRSHVRQYLRSAERHGGALGVYRGREILEHLEVLYELNSQNWSVFREGKSREFFTRAVRDLAATEDSPILGVFRVGGQACGAFQGFESGRTCFLHTAGVARQQIEGMSPGTTMYAMFIRSLIDRGFAAFNMGPGLEEYKLRLGGDARPSYLFELAHDRSRIARWRAFNWLRNTFYRARKRTRAQVRKLSNWRNGTPSSR